MGADQIDDSAYYLLICPQNIVGNTIMTHLHEMVSCPTLCEPANTPKLPSRLKAPLAHGLCMINTVMCLARRAQKHTT